MRYAMRHPAVEALTDLDHAIKDYTERFEFSGRKLESLRDGSALAVDRQPMPLWRREELAPQYAALAALESHTLERMRLLRPLVVRLLTADEEWTWGRARQAARAVRALRSMSL
jgi:hypothetical protein